MADGTGPSRRTRKRAQGGADVTARSAALDLIAARRRRVDPSDGRRSAAFQIKMEEPIYDAMEDDDYAAFVAQRGQEARDFIVDDDGLGYYDDGQEEDWANPAGPYSDNEAEGSLSDDNGKKPQRKNNSKKDPAASKPPPSSLSAAASLMGKQKISSIFTSLVFKKNDTTKGSTLPDSIIDDVIAECAPDETDREERRRRCSKPSTSVHVRSSVHPDQVHGDTQLISSGAKYTNVPYGSLFCGDSKTSSENDVEMVSLGSNHLYQAVGEPMGVVKETKSLELKDEEKSKHMSSGSVKEGNDDAYGEAKVEVEKKQSVSLLNAKVKTDQNGTTSSITSVLKGNNSFGGALPDKNSSSAEEKVEFLLDSDGSLPFYLIDAYEEFFGANSGSLYLFGKVKTGTSYRSCCVVVQNMQRCVYAIPHPSIFPKEKILELEKKVAESRMSETEFKKILQELASGLKNEITERLLDLHVSSFSMVPVKRSYAFERSDIPVGEQYVLKINYAFKDPPFSDLKGDTFIALLGTNTSALELFLIKRKSMGPSWLSIHKFSNCPVSQRVSWCRYEVVVDCPKDISVSTSKAVVQIPPVTVTAINLKTIIGEKHNMSEIVSASLICCYEVKIDSPMLASEWEKPDRLGHFTVLRKLDGGIFPVGLSKEAADRNSRAGSTIMALESSERALLNRLFIELHKWDTDILVGHNISGFDLDVLLHRAQACKVPSTMWSKIGRLKRSVMPKLTKGSSYYGSGASPGIMSCIAGRLLCDTYLCSRDLLREVSYSLTHLAKTQLSKERKEVAPHDIPTMFQTSGALCELVMYGETDALLSLELMFHLSVLPLTRQLTNISGNLWTKTLQGARAQRVEYLLLHSFHAKKFIVPDKLSRQSKEISSTKRKMSTGIEGEEADELGVTYDNEGHVDQVKGRKGPAYAGGLVLEPKKGLYDKYVLLLDFNSLYPSIIQEYNICFTTVEGSPDGLIPNLPSSKATGVLPELLKSLVERRRTVKSLLKTASGLKARQLDIQQQALKLTANSMYGCLGFSNSRFYAKALAELITLQGREILQRTVDLVQNNLNLEVIYGDTDSIMIYSGLDDISKVKAISGKVIQEVNKKYRCLEIDLDGIYKRMLLLKKKKYAAVKLQFNDGKAQEIIERKGLDMVRRDWSLLSKELGDFCLGQILSGGSCEDVVEAIHSSLMKVQEEMRKGEVALEKYVITKTLTKPPEDYPDARNQPHVQVALRMRQNVYQGFSAGDTISYVICCQEDSSSAFSLGVAQRARHPDELKSNIGNWMIDIDYYLSQQIHPVVSRLCASIQGTSPARLADCLGLDSSKFQGRVTELVVNGTSSGFQCIADDNERYHGCQMLRLSCTSCSSSFDCPPVSRFITMSFCTNQSDQKEQVEPTQNFWGNMRCPRCPDNVDCRISPTMLANQVKRQAQDFISLYYRGSMMCDDELCKQPTRTLNLRVVGDSERGTVCPNYPRCNGHLTRQYSEAHLYKQLSYFCYVLDAARFIDKLDPKLRMAHERELAAVHSTVELALSAVEGMRDRCAYGWIRLDELCVSI